MPTKPLDGFKRLTAKRLRARQTGAELALWRMLRTLETNGSHFRRQVPVGPYVVDFACLAAKLIVEVDGSQHASERGMARDAVRTRWLANEGFRVIRFWNNDVTDNPSGVLEVLHAALYGSRDAEPQRLTHQRRSRLHPPPAREARRPSPSRGG
jgi:very-short-patch-repair endonuclease